VEGRVQPAKPASQPSTLPRKWGRAVRPLVYSGRASGTAPGLQWPHRCGARSSYFFIGGCDAVRVLGAGSEPVMAYPPVPFLLSCL